MAKTGPKQIPPLDRFLQAIQKESDGCWIYKGMRGKYGSVFIGDGKNRLAHRFSYEHFIGPIAPGMFICHKCDVRGCVNPDHLYCGTHEDNTRDIVERKRYGKRVLPLIKARRRRNKGRSLTVAEREKLVQEYAGGQYTQAELGKRYAMTQAAVSATIRGWPDRKEDGGKRRTGSYRRKLPIDGYDRIRQEYATGMVTQHELAAKYGIDQTYVSSIIKRKTRKDLADAAIT